MTGSTKAISILKESIILLDNLPFESAVVLTVNEALKEALLALLDQREGI